MNYLSIFRFEDLWQEYLSTSQFSDLRMTTVKLKPDELASFKEAFDMFDKKGDGSISTKVGRASMANKGENLRIILPQKQKSYFILHRSCMQQ